MLIMSKNQQRTFTPNLCLRALGLTGGALFANIALLSRGFCSLKGFHLLSFDHHFSPIFVLFLLLLVFFVARVGGWEVT